jgi:type VI secretion system protein ImpG
MEDLLPYYERELSYLRRYSRDFAQRYPKIAARLAMSGEHSEDPHVERMIQSFALLGARINKKLDDDYPEFTEALLEVMHPHYLRPFPSCSMAQMDAGQAVLQLTAPLTVPRGTKLSTRPVRGGPCTFRTAYDVTLAPITISQVRYSPVASAPAAVMLPANATGLISITLRSTSVPFRLGDMALPTLRAHLQGEQSLVSALADAMLLNVTAAYVEADGNYRWKKLPRIPLTQVGHTEAESLIETPPRSHPAYRLLTEYFAFPEKFDFIDIDLRALTQTGGRAQQLTLHLVLKDLRGDSHAARLLESVGRDHLQLFCTPVVNLFAQHGEPIRINHTALSYPVIGDSRRAAATEVYSIDTVNLVRQTPAGESVTEYRPFYSLRHGESSDQSGHYWFARRDDWVSDKNPGYETEISIVDIDFDPAVPQTDTLSLELTCTNRDLPSMLAFGLSEGDLFIEGTSIVERIAMLRRATPSRRFERGRAAHWRLISHLAMNQVSLTQSGAGPLREMLRLYDLPRTAVSARHIDGIADVTQQAVVHWMPGKPFATFVRGIEITITIDEDFFVGTSLHTFVGVMDAFFATYVHLNSFTLLVVKSKRTGEEIARCQPRSGESILV